MFQTNDGVLDVFDIYWLDFRGGYIFFRYFFVGGWGGVNV